MRRALLGLLTAASFYSLSACKTVSASRLKYATEPTSLEVVKTKLCKDFKKEGDCILSLRGYKSDEKVLAGLVAETPAALKTLKEYGLDYTDPNGSQGSQKYRMAHNSGLTDGEFLALALYTADDYVPMNAALRGDAEKWKTQSNKIYGTASALSKLKFYAFTDTVYRWELADVGKMTSFRNTYKVDNVVVETPFLSTSTDSELDFVSPTAGKVLLKYSIQSKYGVDVKFFSSETSEGEVIFAPGSIFRVTSFEAKKVNIADDEDDEAKAIMVDEFDIGLTEIELAK